MLKYAVVWTDDDNTRYIDSFHAHLDDAIQRTADIYNAQGLYSLQDVRWLETSRFNPDRIQEKRHATP